MLAKKTKWDEIDTKLLALAKEHKDMADYIEAALPFLKKVKGCTVYADGQYLLKRVRGG